MSQRSSGLSSKRAALDVGTLRADVLDSASMWRHLRAVTETGSTNADLLAQAAEGEDIAGSVLLAEFQTAGRGRHGRAWTAPPRSQIAMSVGVDVRDVPTDAWGWLPLLTGVAVVETLRGQYGVEAGLKWPNDVLVDTGKLAGILAEAAGPVSVVVVGLGLNVSLTVDEAPDPAATSLAILGYGDVDRTELAATLLRTLSARVKSWRAHGGADPRLRSDYLRYSRTIGTRVRALLPGDAKLEGSAFAVDDIGRLLIDDGTQTVAISAGDITHLRPAQNA